MLKREPDPDGDQYSVRERWTGRMSEIQSAHEHEQAKYPYSKYGTTTYGVRWAPGEVVTNDDTVWTCTFYRRNFHE